jgi:hypothetical protein
METIILIVLGGLALLAIGFALGLLELAVVIAWKAPLLFLYLVVCFFFPPALLAIPVVGYFWFKGAELEVQAVQVHAQLKAEEEAERFREEMRDRMDEIEEREEYDDY